jgi:hypothetical protein
MNIKVENIKYEFESAIRKVLEKYVVIGKNTAIQKAEIIVEVGIAPIVKLDTIIIKKGE